VKLTRSGSTITAFESSDGSSWTQVASDTLSLPASALVGLAVSSHVSGTKAAATFDSVSVTTTSAPPPPPPPPPQSTLPAGWTDRDIGSVPVAGTGGYANGTYTINGAGADIWGTADAFNFAYTTLSGNGTVIARVATEQAANAWTKAGVMIRETLTAGSAQATMLVSPGKGLAFQRRPQANGVSVNTAGSLNAAPRWVRLTRTGNVFDAYESADGANWTLVGSETIPMGTNVFVGLAVCAHTSSTSAKATFDNVVISNP